MPECLDTKAEAHGELHLNGMGNDMRGMMMDGTGGLMMWGMGAVWLLVLGIAALFRHAFDKQP